jgi:hypothetical protein
MRRCSVCHPTWLTIGRQFGQGCGTLLLSRNRDAWFVQAPVF